MTQAIHNDGPARTMILTPKPGSKQQSRFVEVTGRYKERPLGGENVVRYYETLDGNWIAAPRLKSVGHVEDETRMQLRNAKASLFPNRTHETRKTTR